MTRPVLLLAVVGCLRIIPAADDVHGEDYGYGTGFFVHPEGFLLTNEHVVEGAKEVSVVTSEGNILPARVIRADAYKDLALIKVEVANSPYLPLGGRLT
jgi:S1-C subfamily serine protease